MTPTQAIEVLQDYIKDMQNHDDDRYQFSETAKRALSALISDSNDLHLIIDERNRQHLSFVAQLAAMTAERDELRAKLDAVTAASEDLNLIIDERNRQIKSIMAERTTLRAQLSAVPVREIQSIFDATPWSMRNGETDALANWLDTVQP